MALRAGAWERLTKPAGRRCMVSPHLRTVFDNASGGRIPGSSIPDGRILGGRILGGCTLA